MFLTPEELTTHIYAGVMNAISEDDDSKVVAAIRAAIGEAKGYMSRYNTTAIFELVEEERDPILLMYIKDIAIWHFINLANPNIDADFRLKRYEAAVTWLRGVQNGRIIPEGWPLKTPEEQQSYFQFGSNRRRGSHY